MNPASYRVPQQHQRKQFVDDEPSQGLVYPTLLSPNPPDSDHVPSSTTRHHHYHHQFWEHQSRSQPAFLPLHRQGGGGEGGEGEEHSVLGITTTQHEMGPIGPFFAVNFKLGLNENSSGDGATEAGHHLVAGTNGNSHGMEGIPHPGHLQDGPAISAIKPLWVSLNSGNSKPGTENGGQGVPAEIMRDFYNKHLHGRQRNEEMSKDLDLEDKCRLYGELEDIYGLVKMGKLQANRAGSSFELTGENSSVNAGISVQLADTRPSQVVEADNLGLAGVEHGSNKSVGEGALLARKREKRKRKRKLKETVSFMAGFFENLMKQMMDHQDSLHSKFLEVMERMDAERKEAENKWRRQEAAKCDKEAITRAQEEALAISREAQIVSYIEKLSGQSISLPRGPIASQLHRDEIEDEPVNTELASVNANIQSR